MSSAAPRKFHPLDVRPVIARGGQPMEPILTALAALGPGEGLALIAPFLPSPLIERLQADGFQARPERRADGSWQTFFWRE
ncbi:MAG TPA: DUF2249 domain-containing protein [Opitutus sp.]|nr:DUF2249 domain-containing protein [Opitutus sp.]